MSEFTVTVLRFAFFVMLWLFVFGVAGVLRQDIFGPRRRRNRSRKKAAEARAPQPEYAAVGASDHGFPPPAQAPAPGGQPGYATPAPTRLVVTAGSLAGTVVALGGSPITIGRAPDNTLVITDDYASSYHARFVPGSSGWVLEDLGSTNGTFVGGRRVTSPLPLSTGTAVTIGHTTLELQP